MKNRKTIMLVIAALTLGLVVGGVATGVAATDAGTANESARGGGYGLRLGGAMREAGGRLADVVADLTGFDVADVFERRTEGESFAEIADDKGVKAEEIVDEALAVRKGLLQERVEDGTITQEQADEALARMEARLTDRVSSTEACTGGQGRGGRGKGGGQGRGGGGMGGGACGGACTSAPNQQ